ncbi:copper amine oxidase N-terminal domain-containing protein [Paenibacillus sp. GCM10012303]|uniref:copper amine oxidase N-terminal domain-containing protein n=1 Tax=Paenibacillus sp. GCM10012303 TaxID=3317340 RepID=UPI0036102750
MKRKRLVGAICALCLISMLWCGAVSANQAGERVHWSAAKTFIYEGLHPYTLNWSGDVLDRGGLSLATLKITTSSKDADIVINQYGAMGAAGILKLAGEKLEEATDRPRSGFTNSVTLEEQALYLIKLHDGQLAKIRIDSLSASKASFSYVTEAKASQSSPAPSTEGGKSQSGPGTTPESSGAGAPKQTTAPDLGEGTRWSDSYEVPVPEQLPYPLKIYLTLDSKEASVHDKRNRNTDYRLHTAPFLLDGRTMVPLRFIGEALGAKVVWGAEDQSITLLNNPGITIQLWINNKQAVVNGNTYELDVAPVIHEESAVIPLRFVSEHLNMFVYFNQGDLLITDTENPYFEIGADLKPPSSAGPESSSAAGTEDASFFYGTWNLWIPGGYAPTSSVTHGDGSRTVTHSYTPGAAGDWIEIREDGTYSWLDLGKTYQGKWAGSGSVITLLGGPMDSDWSMRKESDTEVKIFAWGLEYKGSKASE